MKLEALPLATAHQVQPAEAGPTLGLRVLFLLAGLAVVVAAHAPIVALAARVAA